MEYFDSLLNKVDLSKIEDPMLKIYNTGIVPYIIAGLLFLFIVSLVLIIKPTEKMEAIYTKVGNRLIETKNKKIFNYEKIYKKLLESGMIFRHEWLKNPAAYIGVKILLAICFGILFSTMHWILFFAGLFIGYKALDVLTFYTDKKDNQIMQKDIQLIYNALSIQVRSGVYLPNALCECYSIIDPKDIRLKTALLKLRGNHLMGMPFKENIREFKSSFNNQYIDSLCLILEQALESGLAENILADIGGQVKLFTNMQFEEKKANTDKLMTLVMLAVFGSVMYVILTIAFSSVSTSLNSFW